MPGVEIKSVVIVGGGTAGWVGGAPAGQGGRPRPSGPLRGTRENGNVGVGEATIPAINIFNQMLRLDEDDFLRNTHGTIKLGIEFANWYERGHSYMHSFGTVGKDLAYIPFHNYWLHEHLLGRGGSLWD